MKQMADEIFEMYKKKQKQQNLHKKNNNEPQQQPQQEPLLVFHIPPFHSVHHLHLHVLDGASLDVWGRIKYPATTTTRYVLHYLAGRRRTPPARATADALLQLQFYWYWYCCCCCCFVALRRGLSLGCVMRV